MALNEQTEMAFGDRPPRIDPVSGNEVPPGAMPSEVRDDIPARLSEGEYVVPADVLQFFGIKFFEDLRTQAKTELAGLESNGRMGGEPVDDGEDLLFSAEELNTYEDSEPVAANMGGMISGYEEGGVTEMQPIGSRSVLKTYINDDGERLFIRFVNGVAIPPVPPGYREEGTSDTGTSSDNPCPSGYVLKDGVCVPIQSTGSGDDDGGGEPEIFARDLSKMNAAQLAQYAAEISKTNVYKNVTKQPLIGFLARRQSKKVTDYLENQIKDVAKDSNMAEFYQSLLDGIESGDRAGLEELVKEIKLNNPELNTKVLVTGSQINRDREKGSGVVDPLTNSNNTIGLGGTIYGIDISAAQERSFTMPGTTTAQENAATSGGTKVSKTSKVDPFGISSGGEFDTDVTLPVDTSDVDSDSAALPDPFGIGTEGEFGTSDDVSETVLNVDDKIESTKEILEKRKNDATKALSTFDKYGFVRKLGDTIQQLETPVNKVTKEVKRVADFVNNPLANMFKVNEQLDDPTGRFSTAAQMEMNQEADVLNLMNALTSNPQNATNILSKSNLNISAQDSTALASNLMSPRFGYESGRDDLQQRMVTGPGGVERLPLTDSQTLAQQEAMANSKVKASEEAYQKTLAEKAALDLKINAGQEESQAEQDRYTAARQEEAELKEKSSKGIAERVERARSRVGGFNKGGLASKQKIKKRKSK